MIATPCFPRSWRVLLAAGALLSFVHCSMGTNTGNGANGETGGIGGFNVATGGTGGTGGFVPATGTGGTPSCPIMPCEEPVSANGPDGVTYRGSITPDTQIASSYEPSGAGNWPIAALVFSGWPVETTDAGCVYDHTQMTPPSTIRLCITADGSSIDNARVLHVHNEPGVDMNCTGPQNTTDAWGLTFTLTEGGLLTATLFTKPGDSAADAAVLQMTISGQIDAYTNIGPNGEIQPVTIQTGDGGASTFPTTSTRNRSCSP